MSKYTIDKGKLDDLKAGFYHIYNDKDEHVARVYGYENALLFAASAELLEALEEVLNGCEIVCISHDLPTPITKAKSAIAKAKGQS